MRKSCKRKTISANKYNKIMECAIEKFGHLPVHETLIKLVELAAQYDIKAPSRALPKTPGKPITRKKALAISTKILRRAEKERSA